MNEINLMTLTCNMGDILVVKCADPWVWTRSLLVVAFLSFDAYS